MADLFKSISHWQSFLQPLRKLTEALASDSCTAAQVQQVQQAMGKCGLITAGNKAAYKKLVVDLEVGKNVLQGCQHDPDCIKRVQSVFKKKEEGTVSL